MKQKHEVDLARVLNVAPPQAYERGADGERSWWRRALELFGTFRRKHGNALTREEVAEYHRQKAREELRGQVAALAVSGAAQIIEREIDPRTHAQLLDKLALGL